MMAYVQGFLTFLDDYIVGEFVKVEVKNIFANCDTCQPQPQ